MKKLNNKGITTIEVLVCFVLVVTITVAIYTTVSSFNEKKIIEGHREKIYNYKNLLTKEMQDDFIKIGLVHAKYERTYELMYDQTEFVNDKHTKVVHTVDCTLKDGTERKLVIEQFLVKSQYHIGGAANGDESTGETRHHLDDYFLIKYGPPDDLIEWPFPDIGYSGYDTENDVSCDASKADRDVSCNLAKDLSINNVLIKITDDNVLSIYIGFYHPEFGNRYAINVVAPINYIATGADISNSWDY